MGHDTTKSHLSNEKGKSKWIDSQSTKPTAIVTSSHVNICNPLFPSVQWVTAIPALTHRHQQYMVEDCPQCDVNKSLLLLILLKQPSFGPGWQSCLLAVHQAFPTSVLQFKYEGVFFSVEVIVVKNPIRELLMAGCYSVTSFLELFSFCGGSSLALCFVWCNIDGFELKFADIFYSNDSIHLWVIHKDTRDLKGQPTLRQLRCKMI